MDFNRCFKVSLTVSQHAFETATSSSALPAICAGGSQGNSAALVDSKQLQ